MKNKLQISFPYHNILIATALIFLCTASYSQKYNSLGVNITDNGAFVNIVNHTNRYSQATDYDSLGWSLSDFELLLMDGRPAREWSNDIDDPEVYRIDYGGIYKSSFKGRAELSTSWTNAEIQNQNYDSSTNITTFDLVVPSTPLSNHGIVVLAFTNTRRTPSDTLNSGITELKVMHPGYELNTNKIFTDEYINLLKSANFVCYRYYGVQNIWDGEPVYPAVTSWSNRKTPQDAAQISMVSTNGKRDGWCWEYIIELANILKKDIWINLHISCDSAYVVKLAKMLKDSLDPSINIYVENSNEVWSPTQTTHGPYNQAQADYFDINFNENYARRTVELSNLFASVFGKGEINKRIRVVLGAQQAYGGRSDIHLNYINNTFGPPKNYIFATAPTLYFGSTNPNGDTTQINDGMLEDIDGQINNTTNNFYRKSHIMRAETWELPGGCLSYEGGPGLPSGGGKTNLSNQILANRTYKMKEIITKCFGEGWFDIGGGLAMYFTLSSGYNRYGCWGITDDYTKPDRNYKMQAIRELIGPLTVVNDISIENNSTPYAVPNPLSAETEIVFNTKSSENTIIEIYDILCRKVASYPLGLLHAGKQKAGINMYGFQDGFYYFIIKTNSGTQKGILLLQR